MVNTDELKRELNWTQLDNHSKLDAIVGRIKTLHVDYMETTLSDNESYYINTLTKFAELKTLLNEVICYCDPKLQSRKQKTIEILEVLSKSLENKK
ncbi:hypothetical protein UT300012_23530 [Paraclostridium bifermentans]